MTRDESTKSDAAVLTHLLATAAAGDTLMRDLYLSRARALLEPICSEVRYRGAIGDRAMVDRLLAQSRAAVGRQDWKLVEELAGRAAPLRRALETEQAALAAAEEVYGARPVALDPFSRGLARFAKIDAATARTDTLAALEKLARDDQEHRDFYVARSQAIAAQAAPIASTVQAADPKEQGQSAERRAMAAVERGDAERWASSAGARSRATTSRRRWFAGVAGSC